MLKAFILTGLVALAGEAASADEVPDWVLLPPAAPGTLAGAYCVPLSGTFALDRQAAVGQARAQIAQQIEVRVAALDEIELSSGSTAAGNHKSFRSVSRLVAEQALSEVKVVRIEQVPGKGGRQLCVLLGYDLAQGRAPLSAAMKAAGMELDAAEEAAALDSILKAKK